MKKLAIALWALLLAGAAQAQSVSWPPPSGALAFLCVYNSSPPTLTTTNVAFAQCDSTGSLRVAGSFTPSGTQNVNLTQILSAAPSLTNPLWVFPATGATFPVSGTITANQGTANATPWPVTGSGAAGTAAAGVVTVQGIASMTKLLVTPDSIALPANQSVNVSQINAVTPLMGNGSTGTGSQRVTIASDNTAFSVNATLSAETTKVIGTVNQGTSPWVVSGTVSLPAAGTSVVGSVAAGTAAATSVLDGSIYNSTTPTLTNGQQAASQADTTGARRVSTEGGKATYSAGIGNGSLAAATTDVVTITGSASKTIRVTRISVSGTATAAAGVDIQIIKRSTANSGGTSAAITIAPHDSTNAAASATLLNYSANPTLGTTVAVIRSSLMTFTTSAGAIPSVPYVIDFTTRNAQGIVLRGTTQVLAVNLGGATVTGGVIYVDIEWTEE